MISNIVISTPSRIQENYETINKKKVKKNNASQLKLSYPLETT